LLRLGRARAGVVEPRNGAIERLDDRFGGDYRNSISSGATATKPEGGLRRRQTNAGPGPMRAGYIEKSSLFLKRNQAAAAQAGVYLGRGEVTSVASES